MGKSDNIMRIFFKKERCLIGFLIVGSTIFNGCKSEKLPDMNYLREDVTELKSYSREGKSFLPQEVGTIWRYYVSGQKLQQEVLPQDKPLPITVPYIEVCTLLPPVVEGERTIYETSRLIKGKESGGEVFEEDTKGLYLQKGRFLYGPKASEAIMAMDPPLALIKYPMREGEMVNWDGKLRYKDNVYPARGASRMTRRETITTQQGKFEAYRIDTRIYTIDQRTAYTLTMRWFVPDRGMMQMRMVRTGELMSYSVLK
jgi:hypothetical protein